MSSIPYEIYTDITWKYLPVGEIRKLCSVNKRLSEICNDPETWRYLLRRDYGIDSVSDDPKWEYQREGIYDKIRKNIVSYVRERYDVDIDPYLLEDLSGAHNEYMRAMVSDIRNLIVRITDTGTMYDSMRRVNSYIKKMKEQYSSDTLYSDLFSRKIVSRWLDELARMILDKEYPL